MKPTFKMKNKYTTQTSVFDLTSRTILPKKINLKDFMIGHLSVGSQDEEGFFHDPVYVDSFDKDTGVLILLCKLGMFEALSPMVGSPCTFQFSDSQPSDYTLSAVALSDLCFLSLTLN